MEPLDRSAHADTSDYRMLQIEHSTLKQRSDTLESRASIADLKIKSAEEHIVDLRAMQIANAEEMRAIRQELQDIKIRQDEVDKQLLAFGESHDPDVR